MSLEDFQAFYKEPIDNSIIRSDFLKIYLQHGAVLNDLDQNVEFIFGENNYYHQIGNAYLEFDITVRDPTAAFKNNAPTRFVSNSLAFCFKETLLSTTG